MFTRILAVTRYLLSDPADLVRVCLHESKWLSVTSFGDEEPFSMWYHLYENSRGIRQYEIKYTGDYGKHKTSHKRDAFFLNSVQPWAKGIRVKGIDSYQTACQQMTMDELAGKK